MLPLVLGAAAAAILLGGCSEEDSEAPSYSPRLPKKEPEDPPKLNQLSYAPTCLSDRACPEEKRLAGFQDYAVHLFAPRSNGHFDGILSPTEKSHGVSLWGSPKNIQEVPVYMDRVHQHFLRRHSDPNASIQCGLSSLYLYLRGEGGAGMVVTGLLGPHQCGGQYGTIYNHSGLEAQVASNPENWIFFIESSPAQEMLAGEGFEAVEEQAFFGQVARGLSIPLKNPLVSLYDSEVVEGMGQVGLNAKDYAVVLAVAKVNDAFPATAEQARDLNALSAQDQIKVRLIFLQEYFSTPDPRNLNARVTAELFGLELNTFYKDCRAWVTPSPGEDVIKFYKNLKKHLSTRADQAIEISNRLSIPKIKAAIQGSGRNHAFFQMGADHRPILEEMFGPLNGVAIKEILK